MSKMMKQQDDIIAALVTFRKTGKALGSRKYYTELFQTEVEPKLQRAKGRLCARDRRVLVTKLIALAHTYTMRKVRPTIVKQFTTLGYLKCKHEDISLSPVMESQHRRVGRFHRKKIGENGGKR